MAANWTLKEKSNGEMVVTVEGEEWKKACDKAFRKLAQNVQVEGFRKGHVPAQILAQRIPAYQTQVQAVSDNANEWMIAGLKELGLEPVSQPVLDIRSIDADHAEIVFEFTVAPDFEIGQYKDLEYKLGDLTVTEEEYDKELGRLREQYADVVEKDSEAAMGDTVNIDYEGFKDGVAFEGGKAEGYDLELGSNSFIPGFEDQLVGIKAGEEKDLNLTFPENYHAEELKGADVVFHVKANAVKTKILPEVNDDFAKDVNFPGVETAEDLTKLIRDRLAEGKKMDAERAADEALGKALTEGTEIDIPEVMIQNEAENMTAQLEAQLRQYGMNMNQYLSMTGMSREELVNSNKEQAVASVKLRLILDKIAKIENIEVPAEDVENEFVNMSKMYNMDLEDVKKQLDADLVKADLARQKAYEFVKEHVKKAEETAE
ncbi:MAG: trigger factor [Solobacterium sp.]|nr:trigger factor [Solobacterium sp.]